MLLQPLLKLATSLILIIYLALPLMSQHTDIQIKCDPKTGLCEIPDYTKAEKIKTDWKTDREIIYVGDPMCSWCWGISPQLNALQRYGEEQDIPFSLVMGGLRPGGGEEWNKEFKDFLKHHWEEVNKRSNQPFSFDLFGQDYFNYDTEPSCRAVVVVRTIAPEKAHSFYELIQYHFYVESKDPNQVDFYKPICNRLDINFEEFSKLFLSEEMKQATVRDFQLNRQWGVRGYPAVLYRKDKQLYALANGYSEFEAMKERLEQIEQE